MNIIIMVWMLIQLIDESLCKSTIGDHNKMDEGVR
jgi:hypothetical protein